VRRRGSSSNRQVSAEVDGENYEVDSRDKARHIERSDQLYVTRMMLVTERGG